MPPAKLRAQAKAAHMALVRASDPATIVRIAAALDAIEDLMHAAGLYAVDEMLPVNLDRMLARWKLGRALKKIDRTGGPGRGKKNQHDADSFKAYLKTLELEWTAAQRAQRIGFLPEAERDAAFEEARAKVKLLHFDDLITRAKPWWYKERRAARHRAIASKASAAPAIAGGAPFGPFPLIYADPPWTFETFHPHGAESHRMPDDHYPVLGDDQIKAFNVAGKRVAEFAAADAGLFLWCTSSNIVRALAVLEAWGFSYKTHAVWDKMQIGTGLIFRNQHEVLLYGDRGKFPKPMVLFSSVFRYQRTAHSAKPPEIRRALEQMYPAFSITTRLELFSRGQQEGWTCAGFEASDNKAIARA